MHFCCTLTDLFIIEALGYARDPLGWSLCALDTGTVVGRVVFYRVLIKPRQQKTFIDIESENPTQSVRTLHVNRLDLD
jgi:hypothetical protein